MLRHNLVILLLVFTSLTISQQSFSYDVMEEVRKKQVAKNAKRWSLSEWLEQKNKMKLMDMWLMFNAPSPYEFYLGVNHAPLDQTPSSNGVEGSTTSYKVNSGYFGAYVTIVGIHAEYSTSDEEIDQWKANFMLRLLGSSDQSTNLTVYFGLMGRELGPPSYAQSEFMHQVAGGKLDLYILKPFALTGRYEAILSDDASAGGTSVKGSRVEAGAHLEYGALRLYGSWYQEVLESSPGTPDEIIREGILFGLRVYF